MKRNAKWKIWTLDKFAYILGVDIRINGVHWGRVVWDTDDDSGSY